MKRIPVILSLLLFLFTSIAVPAAAEGVAAPDDGFSAEGMASELGRHAGVGEVDRLLREQTADLEGLAPDLSIWDIFRDLWKGGFKFDLEVFLQGLGRYLFGELLTNTSLLAKLVGLAVVMAILRNLQGAFQREAVGQVAQMAGHLVLVALALSTFKLAFGIASDVVSKLVNFMQALLPTLLALLMANGSLASGGLFHPLMSAAVAVASTLVSSIVIPLILVSGLVEAVSGFAPGFRLSGLTGLIKMGSVTVLGLIMSAFLGVASVYKAAGSVADGVALRTGKFMAATFIPVIGKMFADAAELVVGASSLLTSAVGIAGSIGVLVLIAFPLMKLAAIIITYRLAGAVIQPLDSSGIADVVNGIGNTVAMVFVTVACVGLWFFVAVTIMMGSATGAGLRV